VTENRRLLKSQIKAQNIEKYNIPQLSKYYKRLFTETPPKKLLITRLPPFYYFLLDHPP
jgi:hypothetical protein